MSGKQLIVDIFEIPLLKVLCSPERAASETAGGLEVTGKCTPGASFI
jgi:hypothetical protein